MGFWKKQTTNETIVFNWFKIFYRERLFLEDKNYKTCSITVTTLTQIDAVRRMFEEDR